MALTTLITASALALISAALLALAKRLNRKEELHASSDSWRIIDGEYYREEDLK